MSEPGVISRYLTALSRRLPAGIVDELAGGVDDARQAYLRQGLPPGPAAEAAVAEFGDPDVIAACFTRASPARLAARRLLRIGPAVGALWAAALISSRAWNWPVPAQAGVLLGLALAAVIALVVAAALGRAYRVVTRAGLAACAGTATLDAAMITGVILIAPAITWLIAAALIASAARLAIAAHALRRSRVWC
ncbi:MAG TPA: hypothetical protein VFI65_05150 [Streptosporangiaceae bacterium]|nr:hypothetical protein [Streptosporangiaceae bacterium]